MHCPSKDLLVLCGGKTDKLDAARIAAYGYEKKDSLLLMYQVSDALKRLQFAAFLHEKD
jgi:hypothetical protein